MKTRASLFAALFGALALGATACGGDTECGPGTTEVGDTCVPTADACAEGTVYNPDTDQCEGAVCAPGTTLEGNECVPDGTVVCGDGSSYDPESGTCVPDIEDCGEGTVEVDGECVPYDDSLVGDVEELPEPNDVSDDNVGVFEVPAVGEDVTIKGCITPADSNGDGVLEVDYDGYLFQAAGPTLLDVTVDGLNGLSGGFFAIAGDPELVASGWQRIGINLVDDKASRQLYLPKAGVYALLITDGRSVFTGEPAGGEGTCYFTTIEQVAIPAPTAITGNEVAGELGNDVLFYSYADIDEGDLLFSDVQVASGSASAGIVARRNGAFDASAPYVGPGSANQLFTAGYAADDEVVLIVDPEVNFAVAPVDFQLSVGDPGAAAVAEGQNDLEITRDAEYFNYFFFQAQAGDVVRLEIDAGGDTLAQSHVRDADLGVLGSLCTVEDGCTAVDEWVNITEDGLYYIILFNANDAVGDTSPITITRTTRMATELAVGAPSSQTLDDTLTNWYSVDLSGQVWVEAATGTDTLGDDLVYTWYDATVPGVIDLGVAPLTEGFLNGPDTSLGHIVYETDTPNVLVRVEDMTDSSPAGETFEFGIDVRPFEDLGTIDADLAAMPYNITADQPVRFFARAADFAEVDFTAAVTAAAGNLVMSVLDRDETPVRTVDAAGSLGSETLAVSFAGGWVAFEVTEAAGIPTEFDLSGTYEAPEDYSQVRGSLPFATICPDGGGAGRVHELVDDGSGYGGNDEGVSGAAVDISGLDFSLFGEPVSEMTISSNGWMTLLPWSGPSVYLAQPMPKADYLDAVVAPYWVDLYEVTVCTLVAGDEVVVEWQGMVLGADTAVQFQAVLKADGQIDFIYGPDHVDSGATIGIEDVVGARAEVISTSAGSARPGSSWSLVP